MSVDIARTFSPHRGKTSSMATSSKVLADGELFIEYPNSGIGTEGIYSIKIGDGETQYKDLPVAITSRHPTSGVTPGTYNSVTVNDTGHVTAATQNFIYPAEITAATDGLTAKTIVGKTAGGYVSLAANVSVDTLFPLLYAPNAVASSTATSGAILIGACDVSGTTTFSGAGSVLFAKGLLNGTLFTINAFTTTIPSSEDGYEYMELGITAGTNILVFTPNHDIYKYTNGIFGRYSDSGDFGSEDPLNN